VIRSIQQELGATMVYVTHDQTEAMTFADRISVVHAGGILQTGTPEDLYELPEHEHVAHFIGSPGMNLLAGAVEDGCVRLAGGTVADVPGVPAGPCTIGFRPEWARLDAAADGPAQVSTTRVLGVSGHRPVGIVTAAVDGQTLRTRQAIDLEPGQRAALEVDAGRLLLFRDGRRLFPAPPDAAAPAVAAAGADA